MKKVFKEFKEFISKGNVIDMAVGVIIGSAFSKIVSSLVNDIIMPTIGIIIGGLDFTKLSITIKESTINYGLFINTIINFVIVAFAVFLLIKFINKLRATVEKKEEVVEEATTKECPRCYSTINIKATKCPHCTSDI